jgi:hypothetical protein
MSKIFQAYGKFDIKGGNFSFYSEMMVRNNRVQGYVKPIFKNMEVTDVRTPTPKSLFRKFYVRAVKVVTKVLKKQAARASGDRDRYFRSPGRSPHKPGADLVNLIRNAFIKAVLPGFEREVSREPHKQ